ncbi:helix-turn-helix transcriptional regulator [Corynebacterium auriscanis]|uniref:helix-turn-helix transcriptional regulator n=1 Tax=Corynebacterium auriscanis TaxID=99807 RepID=UPI003CEB4414
MTTTMKPTNRYVSIADVAEYAGVSDKTIRRWIASRKLPQYRVGSRVIRVRLSDVDNVFTCTASW